MKIITITLLTLFALSAKAQTLDTLSTLKSKALNYTHHELINPKSYKSIAWSQIFETRDGYKIINVFTAKNHGGKTTKLAYSFNFDKDLYLIYVNTDSIEKQLKDLKNEREQAEKNIQRIKETRDRQNEALKSQQ